MALFVHLTSAKNAARIRRNGLSPISWSQYSDTRGIYCTPLLPDHTATYQWSRELVRWKNPPLVAVHFRIPDDTQVAVGRYGKLPKKMTAAQAVAHFLSLSPEQLRGYEIFLPRAVSAKEIRRIRSLGRPVGWRYMPNAHGRRPCPCPACLGRGEYKVAHLRRRFPYDPPRRPRQEVLAELQNAQDPEGIIALLDQLESRAKADAHRVAHLVDHPDPEVREEVAYLLSGFRPKAAAPLLEKLRNDPVAEVREAAGADEDE